MVQDVLIRLIVIGGLVALAVMAAVFLRHSLDGFHALVCRTPVGRRIVLGLFLAVCIAYGGSKNTSTNEGGAASAPNLIAIEPVAIICRNGSVVDFGCGVGEAGGIGMSLFPCVQPEEVCFSEVLMMEIPTIVGAVPPEGYFTNEFFSSAAVAKPPFHVDAFVSNASDKDGFPC